MLEAPESGTLERREERKLPVARRLRNEKESVGRNVQVRVNLSESLAIYIRVCYLYIITLSPSI